MPVGALHNAHVLIVDDEAENLQILEELFNLQGARVSKANDGPTALEQVSADRPDLVLLDVSMPGMDGFEVCRRLKGEEATRRIPVVMVTGLRSLEDKIQGLEAGADDFLSKPVNAAELMTRSRSLLRIKELGDELEGAYHRLADIASYTNSLLRHFDPHQFNAQTSLKGLMRFLLRPETTDRDRPERVVLLSSGEQGRWSGWLYWREGGRLTNRTLSGAAGSPDMAPIFQGSNIAYRNWGPDEGAEIRTNGLWEKLGLTPPERNLVGFRSDSVAVLALDFGRPVGDYDAQVLSALVATIHFFLKTIASQVQEVENAFYYTIGALARAAEVHDEDTGDHIVRVNRYAYALAEALGCKKDFINTIGYSAQMHDVGKMHVHPDILRKPGRLTEEEWEEVKLHTVFGARILGDDPRLAMAREVALSHHEHWDGSGYPYGLARDEIPLSGRIVMVADVYDALRSPRPYKPSFDHQRTLGIIKDGDDRLKPGWFDPRVHEAFLDLHQLMEEIYREYGGENPVPPSPEGKKRGK